MRRIRKAVFESRRQGGAYVLAKLLAAAASALWEGLVGAKANGGIPYSFTCHGFRPFAWNNVAATAAGLSRFAAATSPRLAKQQTGREEGERGGGVIKTLHPTPTPQPAQSIPYSGSGSNGAAPHALRVLTPKRIGDSHHSPPAESCK